jgi:hypothetical protein
VAIGGDPNGDVLRLGQIPDLMGNTCAKPLRSATPVRVATSLVSETAGNARLPTMTGCTNSTEMCWASVLGAPFPNRMSLPPRWNRRAMAWHVRATASVLSARASPAETRLSKIPSTADKRLFDTG